MRRAFIVLILLSGCASAPDPRLREPTPTEWQAADFGSQPAYYDTAIRTYMEDVLRDPQNATLTIKTGPKKTWVGDAPNFQYGYGVCIEIVERGVYTAYTNFGPTFVLLFNGNVAQMREGANGERLCARLGRAPPGESAN
ncbi:MAG: hypothetical protein EPO08_11065 [Rhodospirillaceae bacterium]|nr:MAG: hypothetical protein EPO08_11065 [Rhodospirillaceae bacterium]